MERIIVLSEWGVAELSMDEYLVVMEKVYCARREAFNEMRSTALSEDWDSDINTKRGATGEEGWREEENGYQWEEERGLDESHAGPCWWGELL